MLSQLKQQQVSALEDFIITPPEQESYERLKAKLVRRLSTSRKQRLGQPLSNVEMADREFCGLTPDVSDDFLRTICASRIPSHEKAILARQAEGSLE